MKMQLAAPLVYRQDLIILKTHLLAEQLIQVNPDVSDVGGKMIHVFYTDQISAHSCTLHQAKSLCYISLRSDESCLKILCY